MKGPRLTEPFRHDSTCPWCNDIHDGMTGVHGPVLHDGRPPVTGDVTVCIHCAQPSILRDDGTWRRPHILELDEMLRNPELARLIKVARAALDIFGPPKDRK